MFYIIFNFNSQLYDRLKIHREEESSDTYWIIWTHITGWWMQFCVAIKCKSNLFNEMHINAMMNKRYWCYNNALPKCDNDDDFLLLLCILWFFFFYFAVTQFYSNPFCAKLFQHDQQKRFEIHFEFDRRDILWKIFVELFIRIIQFQLQIIGKLQW